jgi:hypothetical protein
MNGRLRRLSTRLMPWLPWPAALEPLARRITIVVALMIVSVIAGMLWLSHARVVDAVSDSELARLSTSANQLSNTLRSQARRLLQDGARVAAMPAIREAAMTPAADSTSIHTLLEAERAAAPQVLSIAVWNAGGRLVDAAGADAGERRPDSGMNMETATGPTVSALRPRGDSVLYAVTAPITGVAGRPVGYVVITRQIAADSRPPAI